MSDAAPEPRVLMRANHDLRSSLSVIMGVFDLLDASPGLSEEDREDLTMGVEAVDELVALGESLKLYATIQGGLIELQPQSLTLLDALRAAFEPLLARKHATLARQSAPDIAVLADPECLKYALTGLGRFLLELLPRSASPAEIHLSQEHQDGLVVLTACAGAAAGAPVPAGTPQPAPHDVGLAALNGIRLMALMGGWVRIGIEARQLSLALPAAPVP